MDDQRVPPQPDYRTNDVAPIAVKLTAEDLELLDLWIEAHGGEIGRDEAIRRIVRLIAMRMPS